MRTSAFSSITSPRAVLTMMALGFISLSRRADRRWKVAGVCGTIDRDDVHARQHLVEALPIGRLEFALDVAMDALAVVIVDGKAEAARALRQRLADAAHADDAHALALQPRAQHRGRAPAGPLAGAHQPFAPHPCGARWRV
jgi:hypothetical protein